MNKQIIFTSAIGQQVYQYTEGKTVHHNPHVNRSGTEDTGNDPGCPDSPVDYNKEDGTGTGASPQK